MGEFLKKLTKSNFDMIMDMLLEDEDIINLSQKLHIEINISGNQISCSTQKFSRLKNGELFR